MPFSLHDILKPGNGAVIGFLCLGQSFVLLTGAIDLSCASIVAMTCVVAAMLMQGLGLPWQLAVPLVLVIGALAGMVNGWIIERTGVPPFIVTFPREMSLQCSGRRLYLTSRSRNSLERKRFGRLRFFCSHVHLPVRRLPKLVTTSAVR